MPFSLSLYPAFFLAIAGLATTITIFIFCSDGNGGIIILLSVHGFAFGFIALFLLYVILEKAYKEIRHPSLPWKEKSLRLRACMEGREARREHEERRERDLERQAVGNWAMERARVKWIQLHAIIPPEPVHLRGGAGEGAEGAEQVDGGSGDGKVGEESGRDETLPAYRAAADLPAEGSAENAVGMETGKTFETEETIRVKRKGVTFSARRANFSW